MAKINKVITLHFQDSELLDLLTDEQVGKVIRALFTHFKDKEEPTLETPIEKSVYLSISNSMQRQIDKYEGISSKLEGNQNARKSKGEEPTIDV